MMFRQIVNNLVNNGLKYTNQGGVTINLSTRQIDEATYIVLKITDTGIGIAEEDQDLIWEEFRQVSEGKGRSFEGTGLGLSITKNFVQKLHGEISVTSKPAEGSTFVVTLPVSSGASAAEIVTEEVADKKKVKAPIGRMAKLPEVLYVEDDQVAYSLAKILLRDICIIDGAMTAVQALQMVALKQYTAIMMDINLGRGEDGVETTKRIRKIASYADTPILAITAFASDKDRVEFLAGGFSHYISKPFGNRQLIDIMLEILQ